MCGRFYIDDDTMDDIQRLVKNINEQLNTQEEVKTSTNKEYKGDIHPTDYAGVIEKCQNHILLHDMQWGFPGADSKGVLFNARRETVKEKKMFGESILLRRCIIPAGGYYEWNKNKEKATFTRKDHDPILLAGFWKQYKEGKRFVILTTNANSSARSVHERMPLILEKKEAIDWMTSDALLDDLLKKEPIDLQFEIEYAQQTLPFLS